MGVIFTIPLVLLLLVHLIHISAVPSLSHPLLDISNCLDLGCWKRGDGTRKAASWERGQHLQHYIRQRGESLIRAVCRWLERQKGKHLSEIQSSSYESFIQSESEWVWWEESVTNSNAPKCQFMVMILIVVPAMIGTVMRHSRLIVINQTGGRREA